MAILDTSEGLSRALEVEILILGDLTHQPLQGKQDRLRRSQGMGHRGEILAVSGAVDGNEEVASFKYC